MSDVENDATLPATGGASTGSAIRATELGDRYELRELIGRGGMGEVRDARDKRFERDVAVKLLRDGPSDESTLSRFFREARVQGLLDHPAVVPAYDLGVDAHGNPYFVMKRLAAATLHDALKDPAKWPRPALLSRLVAVCYAVDYAHRRGVVHRDLKPGNIMLGDDNDTYVIDWGLAKIGSEADEISPSLRAARGDETVAGDLLGTPGYMSPEQARSEVVDASTDVFSLGCVLYEILAGRPALPRGLAALDATVNADRLKPSKVAEVPLELDELCARATAGDRTARPTARELAVGIQAFLDGDRDIAKRREHAQLRAVAARTALDQLIAGDEPSRAIAMREAGGAIALDPENVEAAGVLSYLLVKSGTTIPAEALAAADHERAGSIRQVLRFAYGGYAGFTLLFVVLLFLPLHRTWPVVGAMTSCIAILAIVHVMNRRPLGVRSPYFVAFMVLNSITIFFGGIVIGPLFLLPWVVIGGIGQFAAFPARYPPLIIPALFWLPIALLVTLELAGILPSTFQLQDGSFVVSTWVFDLTPTVAAVLLIGTAIVQTFNSMMAALSHRRAAERSQDRIHAQTWHLRRLLPQGSIDNRD